VLPASRRGTSRTRKSRPDKRPRPTATVGYRRILVPVGDDPQSDKALDVACRLAAEKHATLTAIAVIEIPPLLPLDSHMLEEEDEAHRLLDRAEAVGASYRVTVSPRILRAREAAIAIAEQARSVDAELVVIGTRRKGGRSARAAVLDRPIYEALKRTPCRVMVVAAQLEAGANGVAKSGAATVAHSSG
jgi:nucleotide-binding universal stress UspA family protein